MDRDTLILFVKPIDISQFYWEFDPCEIQLACLSSQVWNPVRVWLERIKCSCYTLLEALIILVLDIYTAFFLWINWEFDVRAAVQRSVFRRIDVKWFHSLISPVASSLIKILNSFVKCLHKTSNTWDSSVALRLLMTSMQKIHYHFPLPSQTTGSTWF